MAMHGSALFQTQRRIQPVEEHNKSFTRVAIAPLLEPPQQVRSANFNVELSQAIVSNSDSNQKLSLQAELFKANLRQSKLAKQPWPRSLPSRRRQQTA